MSIQFSQIEPTIEPRPTEIDEAFSEDESGDEDYLNEDISDDDNEDYPGERNLLK